METTSRYVEYQSRDFSPYSDSPLVYSSNIWDYLEHPAYSKYQHMHKMFLGRKGAEDLVEIADTLRDESDARLLGSAASAYLEASLIRTDLDTETRLCLAGKSQLSWEQALYNDNLLRNEHPEFIEYTSEYSIAVNLAVLPIVRGVILGNVKPETIKDTVWKLLEIADLSRLQGHLAMKNQNNEGFRSHQGLQHELNTMIAIMIKADPKFIAIPSSDRADSGFYNEEQTHDISLISQHYGDIRNIIPIEVKSKVSRRDRDRYKAMLVRGKMHLSLPNLNRPEYTTAAFKAYLDGSMTHEQEMLFQSIQETMSRLISLYKQGGKYTPLQRKSSATSYYSSSKVSREYTAA